MQVGRALGHAHVNLGCSKSVHGIMASFVDFIEDLPKTELLTEDAIYESVIYKDYVIKHESDLEGENYTNNIYIIFGQYAGIDGKTMKKRMLEYILDEAEFFESACETPLKNRGFDSINDWLIKISKKVNGDLICVFALSVMLNVRTIVLSLTKYWCTHFMAGDVLVDTNASDVVLGLAQVDYFCQFVRRDKRLETVRRKRIEYHMKGTEFGAKPSPTSTRSSTKKSEEPNKPLIKTRSQDKKRAVAVPIPPAAPIVDRTPRERIIGEVSVIPQPEFRFQKRYRFHCVVKGCKFVAKSVKEWNMHHRTKHGHKKYKCNVCAKICTTITSMKRHTYTHGDKNHVCPDCDTKFAFASELKAHKKVHQNYGSYMCTYAGCRKSYKKQTDLLVHISATHKPEKHKCKDCGTVCKTLKYLKDHMKTHTSVVKCKQCPKTFKHRRSMYRHLATHK